MYTEASERRRVFWWGRCRRVTMSRWKNIISDDLFSAIMFGNGGLTVGENVTADTFRVRWTRYSLGSFNREVKHL